MYRFFDIFREFWGLAPLELIQEPGLEPVLEPLQEPVLEPMLKPVLEPVLEPILERVLAAIRVYIYDAFLPSVIIWGYVESLVAKPVICTYFYKEIHTDRLSICYSFV